MDIAAQNEMPEFREWSDVAVRLLQGVVYPEDGRPWDVLLRNLTPLEEYFGRVGLQLVVDEVARSASASQGPALPRARVRARSRRKEREGGLF